MNVVVRWMNRVLKKYELLRFSTLEPDFKREIWVTLTTSNDMRVLATDLKTKDDAIEISNALVRAAHIVALQANLRMVKE